jgi:diguanylate cyclase (GGDEF)-like protein/PAS domain S-box-containing protein
MPQLIACITEQHDPRLVGLAALVCLLAAITAVSLLARAQGAAGRVRAGWLCGAGMAFGAGVWATHLIAMLGYLPTTGLGFGLGYDVPLVALSLAVALAATTAAFAVAMRGGLAWAAAGGAMLGLGIGSMHFLGVAALQSMVVVRYAAVPCALAWLAGVAFGAAALCLAMRRQFIAAAALAALAVVGLHFIAMTGTSMLVLGSRVSAANVIAGAPLAGTVAGVVLLILVASLIAAVADAYLERRNRAEALRLRRFADSTFEGIVFLRENVVSDVNAPLCRMLGRAPSEIIGRRLEEFIVRPRNAAPQAASTAEAELLGADGATRPIEILIRKLAEGGGEAVMAVRDLSDRKRAEQRIQHLAHHDSLTGLANRALFRDRLAQAMALAERSGRGVALLCLDLDGFKAVNDLLGHPVGDAVLVEVGNRLVACLRDSDTVARLGGDEFAIVQSFIDQPRGAAGLAARLVELLAEPFEVEGQRVCIGTSVGVALFPSDATAPETLLRNADLALYRAKHDGKGTFRFFEQAMDERLQQRRMMEQELRLAMLREEFSLHYQPLFDGASLAIEGFEALLRWQHPERGRISPGEFVPVAEESGLIAPLGRWVLQTACAEAASWPVPWRVAVNLSPAQFKQRDLPQMVGQILRETGLAAARLELEITEGILIDDSARALVILGELKALGVRIALDDFGTGYSSLSYLRRFPFDKLKIDASFVRALGEGGEAEAIVRAIMALGRSLGLSVTAEGVETEDQLARLRAEDCDQVQGFLLGRPMPPDALPLRQEAMVSLAATA